MAQTELDQLLAALEQGGFGGGGFNLPQAGFQLGGGILGGLGKYLTGGTRRKRVGEVFDISKGLLSEASGPVSAADIGRRTSIAEKSLRDVTQAGTTRVSKRLGIESGAAQKQIIGQMGSTRANIFTTILNQAERLKMEQKLAALRALFASASAS